MDHYLANEPPYGPSVDPTKTQSKYIEIVNLTVEAFRSQSLEIEEMHGNVKVDWYTRSKTHNL